MPAVDFGRSIVKRCIIAHEEIVYGSNRLPIPFSEVGKAQLEAQSATSAIAEDALCFNFLF